MLLYSERFLYFLGVNGYIAWHRGLTMSRVKMYEIRYKFSTYLLLAYPVFSVDIYKQKCYYRYTATRYRMLKQYLVLQIYI